MNGTGCRSHKEPYNQDNRMYSKATVSHPSGIGFHSLGPGKQPCVVLVPSQY